MKAELDSKLIRNDEYKKDNQLYEENRQHQVQKLELWQEELEKKDNWLHLQIKDTEQLKEHLKKQNMHINELESNLQHALRDKEFKLYSKEKEVIEAIQKESELLLKLESERKHLDHQIRELATVKEKEKLVEKGRQELNNEI